MGLCCRALVWMSRQLRRATSNWTLIAFWVAYLPHSYLYVLWLPEKTEDIDSRLIAHNFIKDHWSEHHNMDFSTLSVPSPFFKLDIAYSFRVYLLFNMCIFFLISVTFALYLIYFIFLELFSRGWSLFNPCPNRPPQQCASPTILEQYNDYNHQLWIKWLLTKVLYDIWKFLYNEDMIWFI